MNPYPIYKPDTTDISRGQRQIKQATFYFAHSSTMTSKEAMYHLCREAGNSARDPSDASPLYAVSLA